MSSQNNAGGAALLGLILLGMILYVVAFVVIVAFLAAYAIATFLALVLTLVCFVAWNRPLRIGRLTVMPDEARAFVGRGVVGAILMPAFALFCEVLFGIRLDAGDWPYIVLGGYAAGSVGMLSMDDDEEDDAARDAVLDLAAVRQLAPPAHGMLPPPGARPPQPPAPAPGSASQAAPAPPSEPPFRYASWDDEMEAGTDPGRGAMRR